MIQARIVEVDEPTSVCAPTHPLDFVAFPHRVVLEVLGTPFETFITLRYNAETFCMEVVEVVSRKRAGGASPVAPGLRKDEQQRAVAEAVLEACTPVRLVDGDTPAFEPTPGRVTEDYATQLTFGRSKRKDRVALQRDYVVKLYRQMKAAGHRSHDVYADIATRTHLGRTTVYTYLRDAGEVGRRR